MMLRHLLAPAAALVLSSVIIACGSSGPAWRTWQSASCEALFDLPEAPETGRSVSPTPLGDVVLTTHGTPFAKPTRLIYGCRQLPPSFFMTHTEDSTAKEVIDVEAAAFDATWLRGPVTSLDQNGAEQSLTNAKGEQVHIRARAYQQLSRAHATMTIGVPEADTKRFVASVTPGVRPDGDNVTVRSAECLSSVVFPRWPSVTFMPGSAQHLLQFTGRMYQLRCVFVDEATKKLAPAELFARVVADTTADTAMTETSHKDVELAGRHGRDFVFTSSDGGRHLQVRFIIDGDRLQIASVDGTVAEDAIGRAFLDSLALLHPLVK